MIEFLSQPGAWAFVFIVEVGAIIIAAVVLLVILLVITALTYDKC